MTLATDHLAAIRGGARQDPRDSASGAAPSYRPSAQQHTSYVFYFEPEGLTGDGKPQPRLDRSRTLSKTFEGSERGAAVQSREPRQTSPLETFGWWRRLSSEVDLGLPRAWPNSVQGFERSLGVPATTDVAVCYTALRPRGCPSPDAFPPKRTRGRMRTGRHEDWACPLVLQVLGPARVLLVTGQRKNVGCCPRPGKCWCQSETYRRPARSWTEVWKVVTGADGALGRCQGETFFSKEGASVELGHYSSLALMSAPP